MSMVATSVDNPGAVVYPESDGAPMADNPTQGRAIRYLVHGFERLFHGRSDVFVGGDFFWYPVEGQPSIVQAPDVTVIAGLPGPIADRDMPSYRQWMYGGYVLLAVEVLSPSNTPAEMTRKLAFYDRHGVREYWVFDPYAGVLQVYARQGDRLVLVGGEQPVVCPVTGVTAAVVEGRIHVTEPGGRVWLSALEESLRLDAELQRADVAAQRAAAESQRADAAGAEVAALRAELARLRAEAAAGPVDDHGGDRSAP